MSYELEMELENELEAVFGRRSGQRLRGVGAPPPARLFRELNRFGFDKSVLAPHHPPIIAEIAARVRQSFATGSPVASIRLVGHADSRGPDGYNEALGLRRARTVQAALQRAIGPGLSSRIGFQLRTVGEKQPAADNQTPAGRALNRRVSVFLGFGAPSPVPTRPQCLAQCQRDFQKCPKRGFGGVVRCVARKKGCEDRCPRH